MKLHYRNRLEVAYLSVCMKWCELELPLINLLCSIVQLGISNQVVPLCFILMNVFELDGTQSTHNRVFFKPVKSGASFCCQ